MVKKAGKGADLLCQHAVHYPHSPVSGLFPVPPSYSTRSESSNQLILMSGIECDWSIRVKMWNSDGRPRPFRARLRPVVI